MTAVDVRPLLRFGLTAVVIADLVSFYFFLADARDGAVGLAAGTVSDLVSRPAVTSVLILAGIASAVAFASAPGRLWYGAGSLAALMLLSGVHAELFGSPWRHLYYSGLCLAGWLLGLAVSRRRGVPADESYARTGSIALLAAAYLNAGISKVVFGGFVWISGLPIQAAVVAQDGMTATGIVGTYQSWVVATPAVAALFSILTVGFELAAPLMIAGRRARICVVVGLLAMHLNIYVMTPILYWESMVLLLLFGLSAERPDSASGDPILLRGRTFAVAATALAVGAVFLIGKQATRFAASRAPASVDAPPVAAVAPPAPDAPPESSSSALSQAGPFAVGQAVADTWIIDALAVEDDAIVIALAGEPGRVRFEVSCRSQHRSPFDLGAARIMYSQHVEFGQLEGAGWALRRRLEEAAAGGDVCDRLARWRASAQ